MKNFTKIAAVLLLWLCVCSNSFANGFIPKPYYFKGLGVTYNATLNLPMTDLFIYPDEIPNTANLDEIEGLEVTFGFKNEEMIGLYRYEYYAYGQVQQLYLYRYANQKGYAEVDVTISYRGKDVTNTLQIEHVGALATNDTYRVPLSDEVFSANVLNNDQFLVSAQKNTSVLQIDEAPIYGTAEVTEGTPSTIEYRLNGEVPNYTFDSLKYTLTTIEGETASATVYFNIHHNPYASRVIDYLPAPGQFTNKLDTSGESALGGSAGLVSLGGFGGYIIFAFDQPVVNRPQNPYGVDFTIKGNSFIANLYGVWSEPGAVQVMKDLNGNGVPDDGEWYELAGSDYYLNTTKKNVEMTYYNPHYNSRYTVPWSTNQGENGALLTNTFHNQSYYPDPAIYSNDRDSVTFSGNIIKSSLDMSTPSYVEFYRAPAFGYCDNRGSNQSDLTIAMNPYYNDSKGNAADGFDLSWAIDKNGNYVELDTIHFIKVYTAGSANAGWLGEWSTEVAQIAITTPEPDYVPQDYYLNYIGITQLKVIKGQDCQFEGFLFRNGRPSKEGTPRWWVSDETVGTVDNTGKFSALNTGQTWMYFSQKEDIAYDSIQVKVVELTSVMLEMEGNSALTSDSTSLIIGEKIYITAHCTDNIAEVINGSSANRFTYETFDWTTTNPDVGTINNGLFTGKKSGRTTVYARSVSKPELVDSIVVIVNEIPPVQLVSNLYKISYYNPSDILANTDLFITGTNSTVYLNSVSSKTGLGVYSIDQNQLLYEFTPGCYGTDTLIFEIESYGIKETIEMPLTYMPDAFAAPQQVLYTSDAGTGMLKAYIPTTAETVVLAGDLDAEKQKDLVIDGGFAYLTSGNKIRRYNLSSYELVSSAVIDQNETDEIVNKAVIYNNLLLVTGRSAAAGSDNRYNLYAYNKTDLTFVGKVGFTKEPVNLVIVDNKAYVLVTNENTTKSIAIVDLLKLTYEKEIPLNTSGQNISTLVAKDKKIYGIRGYANSIESAVLVFNTTNNSYSLNTTGGLETLFTESDAAIIPATDESLFLVNGNGFTPYNTTKNHLEDGIVMAQSGFYPMSSAYDKVNEEFYVSYSNAANDSVFGAVYNKSFANTARFDEIGGFSQKMAVFPGISDNEAVKRSASTIYASNVYERATTNTNITINKSYFTDAENDFNVYVRNLHEHADWLTLDETYISTTGIRLLAKYEGDIDNDSIVILTIEAIDNFGFSAMGELEINLYPRIYRPVVANPIDDIELEINPGDIEILITDLFSYTSGGYGSVSEESVLSNSNEQLVTVTLTNDTLLLSFAENMVGEAVITIAGTAGNSYYTAYGEKTTETSFVVTVIDPDDVESLDRIKDEKGTYAYPNPFYDYLMVKSKEAGIANIFNATGNCVESIEICEGDNKIDTSRLPSGVYILKFGKRAIKLMK